MKYSKEELKTWAKQVLVNPTSTKSTMLILNLTAQLQMPQEEVWLNIQMLSR